MQQEQKYTHEQKSSLSHARNLERKRIKREAAEARNALTPKEKRRKFREKNFLGR